MYRLVWNSVCLWRNSARGEIGIRKTLGASSYPDNNHGKLFLIASLVAIPGNVSLMASGTFRVIKLRFPFGYLFVSPLTIAVVTLLTVGFETWHAPAQIRLSRCGMSKKLWSEFSEETADVEVEIFLVPSGKSQ